eukprot:5444569-Amphidinium_carterae.1
MQAQLKQNTTNDAENKVQQAELSTRLCPMHKWSRVGAVAKVALGARVLKGETRHARNQKPEDNLIT